MPVTPGAKYALIVTTGSYLLGEGPSNPYTGGGLFFRTDGFPYDDNNPADQFGWDMFFRTYGAGPYGVPDQQQSMANAPIDPLRYGQSFTPTANDVSGFDFYFQSAGTATVQLEELRDQ